MTDKETNSETMVQNKQYGTRSQLKKLDGIDDFRWSKGFMFVEHWLPTDLPTWKFFPRAFSSPYQFTETSTEDTWLKLGVVCLCVCMYKVHIYMYMNAALYICVYTCIYVYAYILCGLSMI